MEMEIKFKIAGHFKIGERLLVSVNKGIMPLLILTIQKEGNQVDIETPKGHIHFWCLDELMYLAPKGADNES